LSFGGGGETSTGVTAHVHSNATGEGGSLTTANTLIDNGSLYVRILAGA